MSCFFVGNIGNFITSSTLPKICMFRTSLTSDVSLLRYLSKPNFWYSFSFKLLKTNSSKFQSTYPRRVRWWMFDSTSILFRFQSTHPRRVRLKDFQSYESKLIFQSTHPRRVRRALLVMTFSKPLFQSTHPRRVRPNQAEKQKIIF